MNKQILPYVIENQSKLTPDSIAVEHGDYHLSYQRLNLFSETIAYGCASFGSVSGEVIGVYMKSSPLYVASIIGANKAGGIFMPLEVKYPFKRLQELLGITAPKLILTTVALKEDLEELCISAGIDAKILVISIELDTLTMRSEGLPLKTKSTVVLPDLDGNDPNYLIYTSGSTGKPKIIKGQFKSLSHFIHWEVKEFELSEKTRVCQFAPISFDVSFRDIFVPLLAGGTLVIPEEDVRIDPNRFIHWVALHNISLVHIVPSFFRVFTLQIDEDLAKKLSTLKLVLLAGEPLFNSDVLRWREKMNDQTELVNLYGPSETTLAKIYHRIDTLSDNPNEIVPLGTPISNSSALIIKNNRLCNIGEIGEILIKTPFRSKGYFKDENQNLKSFVQNPLHSDFEDIVYKTGDLGKYLSDKKIAFVGRIDHQVKIRGNRVELKEVEQAINQIEGITQSIIIPLELEKGNLLLAAYYTASKTIEEGEIKKHLLENLPPYMHPTYYVILEAFPLNLNGKIDRKALPRPKEVLYADIDYIAPSTDIEKRLAKIWSEVLGLDRIGITVSFFKLGGHSLSAVQVLAKIHQEFQSNIGLNEFFEFPTVKAISERILVGSKKGFESIPLVPMANLYKASNSQKRIFLIDQQQTALAAYNMPVAFKLKGAVHPDALKEAFESVIRRHESLRTNFFDKDGVVYQKINDESQFILEEINQNDMTFNESSIALHLQQVSTYGFKLKEEPLLRARLVAFSEQEYLFVFNIHHIISDGFSMSILTREILEFYRGAINKKIVQLPELSIQYKDYSAWLANKTEDNIEAKEYWKAILSQELSAVNLPWDFPKTGLIGFEGDTCTGELDVSLSEEVRVFCRSNEISLFVFFQSMLYMLLYKLSGQNKLMIGTPVLGREHPQLQHQIGMFLNYLVLQNQFKGELRYTDFIHDLKKKTIKAFRFQDYPFDSLVDDFFDESKASSSNPFYDVLLVMNNSELNAKQEDLSKLSELMNFEWISLKNNFSKVDLTFLINDEEQIGINIEYSKQLFKISTIESIQETLFKMIKETVAHPEFSIDRLLGLLGGNLEKGLLQENRSLISENF